MGLDIEAIKRQLVVTKTKLPNWYTEVDRVVIYSLLLVAEVERLRAQIDRVRELHKQCGCGSKDCTMCDGCGVDWDMGSYLCPTVQALEETE